MDIGSTENKTRETSTLAKVKKVNLSISKQMPRKLQPWRFGAKAGFMFWTMRCMITRTEMSTTAIEIRDEN